MELLLIRHGLPIRRELTEGIADPELAEEGHAQARHLGEYLASEHLDAVYASSLRRAQETAAPVVTGRGLELIIEPDVAEYDKDSSEYVPVEELKAANDPRWQAMLDGTWEGGEDEETFNNRTIGAIERIIDAHRGERVAIVCHGGVINAYLTRLLDLSVGQRGFFYPNYTSIHRVAAASSGERSIVTINETSHLRGTGLPMGLFQKG
ncbi:MAG: putative phosphoglycerate mutase [Ilumatobacter sp.]|jgi:probable phosphoglycerate mutase